MRNELEKKLMIFCERADIKLLYIPEKYAVNIESIGLYNFTQSKIFETLKNNYIEAKNVK